MTTSCALLLCLTLLSAENMSVEKTERRARNCIELAQLSATQNFDPLMVISIAHTESRFSKRAVSSAGAVGMMQVLPKYFCPKRGKCNYTQAGLRAWRAWSKGRSREEALCRYNSGKPCKKSPLARHYSRVVMRKHRELKKEYADFEFCAEKQ